MNVNVVLEQFRNAEYHYPKFIWHDIGSVKFKSKLTRELVKMTAQEFKALLLSNLFLPKTVSKQRTDTIVEEGDAAEAPPQVLWGNEKMKLENNGI
jgi:hypothetical protein